MSLSVGLVNQMTNSNIINPRLRIYIGYIKHGRNYLDKQVKAPDMEQQIHHLIEYYKQRFSKRERAVLRWVYCQRPIIQICEITVSRLPGRVFPLEVHFESIETSYTLSAAMLRPGILHESGRMFHETEASDVDDARTVAKRKVLCIGHVIDKTYLAWPLALSFIIATVVAVIAGVATQSVSSGAELGSFIGVGVVLSWSYILWLLG